MGGAHSVIIRSADRGVTWSVALLTSANLNAIAFLDNGNGWAVGEQEILHSSDGGTSWNSQRSNVETDGVGEYLDVAFADSTHGVVVGDEFATPGTFNGPAFILVTSDGGAHWQRASLNGTPSALGNSAFTSVCFTDDASVGIAVGFGVSGNVVFLTADHGATWTDITTRLPTADTNHVACSGTRDLAVTAGSNTTAVLFRSSDGGVTWTDLSSHLPAGVRELHDVSFVDPATGWAPAFQGETTAVVVHTADRGASWTTEVLPMPAGATLVTSEAVGFATTNDGLVVGSTTQQDGSVVAVAYVTTNGGASWATAPLPAEVTALVSVAIR